MAALPAASLPGAHPAAPDQQYASPDKNRKRKSSTNDDGTERVIKHRSSQACQSCRLRKVRCDVLVTNGGRCTNCRLDHMECIVLASRRGKNNHGRRRNSPQASESILPPQTAQSSPSPQPPRRSTWAGHDNKQTPTLPESSGSVPVCVTFDQESDNAGGEQPTADDLPRSSTDHPTTEVYGGFLTPETASNALHQYQSPSGMVSLPPFIAPISNRLPSEDLAFLAQKGAMTVPESDLQLEILRCYLFSVHPFMPMLDYRNFVHTVLNNREDGRISLLLFQAVMFAGLHSLSSHLIRRLGFDSVKQARDVFFHRARLLYEFDVEPDGAAVVQSLILLSSWYGKWHERKHTWHWTGLAYDIARNMGLHREPTVRYPSEDVRRFRRRLWWSLYIRDRMIALGTRRPMRIPDDSFDVSMLTLDDFDLEPLEEFHQGLPLAPSAQENTATALMCIELAKLSSCIGRVVTSQYTTLSTSPDVPHTMMVVTRRGQGSTRELERSEEELNEWLQALGANVRRTGPMGFRRDPHSCSEIHWAMLNMAYWTTVNVLHRAQALMPLSESTEDQVAHKLSRSKVKESARRLTKMSQIMLAHDQVRFLSLLGVTALIAAYLSHMLDVTSSDEDVRDASTFRLHQSLEVLQVLRDIYASADAAVAFLASVARTAGVSLSPQVAESSADVAPPMTQNAGAKLSLRQDASGLEPTRGAQDVRWASADDRSTSGIEYWPSAQFQTAGSSSKIRNQLGASLNRPTPTIATSNVAPAQQGNAGSTSPSAVAFAHSTHPTPGSQEMSDRIKANPRNMQAAFVRHPDAAPDGPYFDWNTGTDFEPLAFNYDFYSTAFGFLDGPYPAM